MGHRWRKNLDYENTETFTYTICNHCGVQRVKESTVNGAKFTYDKSDKTPRCINAKERAFGELALEMQEWASWITDEPNTPCLLYTSPSPRDS